MNWIHQKIEFRTYIKHSGTLQRQNFVKSSSCKISTSTCNILPPVCKPTCIELPERYKRNQQQTAKIKKKKKAYQQLHLRAERWRLSWCIVLLLQLKYRAWIITSWEVNSYKWTIEISLEKEKNYVVIKIFMLLNGYCHPMNFQCNFYDRRSFTNSILHNLKFSRHFETWTRISDQQ